MTNYNAAHLIYKYKCCSPKCLYEWKSEIAPPGPKQCRLCKNTHWADPLWFDKSAEKARFKKRTELSLAARKLKPKKKYKDNNAPKITKEDGMEDIRKAYPELIAARKSKERKCLKCEKPFISNDIGNRLCDPCRRANKSDAGIFEHAVL